MPEKSQRQSFTILGSGAAVPEQKRGASANLLRCGDAFVLIDAGRGFIAGLYQLGVDPFNINHICLTHFHPDHSAELVSLVFGRYNNPALKWTVPLELMGGTGLRTWWQNLCMAWPGLTKPLAEGLLKLHEIAPGEHHSFGGWQVVVVGANHKPESATYRFTRNAKRIVVSGDTGPYEALAMFARQSDLLVLECGAGDVPVAGHLTVYDAARIAGMARARHVVLTHFYSHDDVGKLERIFRSEYNNPFQIASDLLEVEV